MLRINGDKYDSDKPEIRKMYSDMAKDYSSARRKKMGLGLGIAVLAAALATTPGRNIATNMANGIVDTGNYIKNGIDYGEAGNLPYAQAEAMLGISQTPENLAKFYNSRGVQGVDELITKYIMAKNNLPSRDTIIKKDQGVFVLVYDPENGRGLGDLVEEATKKHSN